jgi:two-component system, OmpR family, alkaline phosphatase synthesis response regulator PhoP
MALKVLIVDDEPTIRHLFSCVVERLGNVAFQASNGEQAEAIAIEVSPNLILLDIMMPHQDGYQTCMHLRDNGYRGIIIMVSALLKETTFPLAQACGADDYLQKPVAKAALEARINAVIE